MIHYILQILAFQLLFLAIYDLFLKKETFFNWNRVYLILTPLLSFILPLVKINAIKQNVPPEYIIQLPDVLISYNTTKEIVLPEVVIHGSDTFTNYFLLISIFRYLWYFGMVISTLLLAFKIYKIIKIRQRGVKSKVNGFTLISVPNTTIAFSFLNTIYLGSALAESKKANIVLHEKIHVKEYHSMDLIFFEVLRILLWFNPLIYIYQNRIATLQEYIADAKAIAKTNKKEYYQGLLSQIFQTERISFINTFFNHSLIKNRIVMLQKSKSKKIFQLKYLLLIPVVCGMLIYTSCTQDTIAQSKTNSQSTLLEKIEAVKHQIEIQGNVSKEEEKALKVLTALVSDDFSNPIHKEAHEHVEIPFGSIEKIPVFPGCEGLSKEEAKKCFSTKIAQFVGTEFNTKIGKDLKLSGRQKIFVKFKIDKRGYITDIHARGPLPELETEAFRVINKLPKMEPGTQEGINVAVNYSLPIIFEIK